MQPKQEAPSKCGGICLRSPLTATSIIPHGPFSSTRESYRMYRLERILLSAVVLLLAAPFAAAGELPTAKPKDVGLGAGKVQKAHYPLQPLTNKKEIAGPVCTPPPKAQVS